MGLYTINVCESFLMQRYTDINQLLHEIHFTFTSKSYLKVTRDYPSWKQPPPLSLFYLRSLAPSPLTPPSIFSSSSVLSAPLYRRAHSVHLIVVNAPDWVTLTFRGQDESACVWNKLRDESVLFVVKKILEEEDDLLMDRFSNGGDDTTSYHNNFKNNSTGHNHAFVKCFYSFCTCHFGHVFFFCPPPLRPRIFGTSLHDILLVLRRLADNLRGRKHRSQETFSDPLW